MQSACANPLAKEAHHASASCHGRRSQHWPCAVLHVHSRPAEGAKVEVSEKEPFGKYLTDAEGMSLYLFEADGKLNSTCSDACAQA
jgi:predicted lipoprotein with Yx(FWY)xxD motif